MNAQYELLEKLGAGGMGQVYRARDTRLNRLVAIKILRVEGGRDVERQRRFIQEAQAASALNHPNIITIHDLVEQDGQQMMVMELVSGKSLAEVIANGPLPLGNVLDFGAQIADALMAAHSIGIVHRDLKPANVMVTDRGFVKVLDFGLAKLLSPEHMTDSDETRSRVQMTVEGTLLGTVAYMSPEQAQGRPVDARSDIFSFGAVLYEMITGRRAFDSENTISTLTAVLRDEARPIPELAPNIPPDLQAVVNRCLRKLPEQRYQNMAEIRGALQALRRIYDGDSRTAILPASSFPPAALPTIDYAQQRPTAPPATPGTWAPPSSGPAHPPSWPPQQVPQQPQPAESWVPPSSVTPPPPPHATPWPPQQAPPPGVSPGVEKPKKKNSWLLPLLALLLIGGLVAGWFLWPRPANKTQVAQTQTTSTTTTTLPPPAPTGTPETVPPPTPAPEKTGTATQTTGEHAPRTQTPPPAPAPQPPPAAPPPIGETRNVKSVMLPEGTPFRVALAEDIPNEVNEGAPISFVVPADVKVNGETVIAKGATASGVIDAGKKKRIFGRGKATYHLTSVNAVDGKSVRIRSTPSKTTGDDSKRPVIGTAKGTEFPAYVDGDVQINVRIP